MGPPEKRPKRDKRFYQMQAKKAKFAKFQIVPGVRGFLGSCNSHEKEAVKEAYNVLNEFADQVYGPETGGKDDGHDKTLEEEAEEEEDIEAALAAEQKELAEIRTKKTEDRRFQMVNTGVQNLIFIRTTLTNPNELASCMFDSIQSSGTQKTRYLLRLVPIVKTCKAYVDNVSEALKEELPKWFKDKGSLTYSVNFKARLNNNFGKEEAVTLVNLVMKEVNPEAKVEYKTPDLIVLLEVMKGLCCIGVLPNFFKFRKYNLVEAANVKKVSDEEPSKEVEEQISS